MPVLNPSPLAGTALHPDRAISSPTPFATVLREEVPHLIVKAMAAAAVGMAVLDPQEQLVGLVMVPGGMASTFPDPKTNVWNVSSSEPRMTLQKHKWVSTSRSTTIFQ